MFAAPFLAGVGRARRTRKVPPERHFDHFLALMIDMSFDRRYLPLQLKHVGGSGLMMIKLCDELRRFPIPICTHLMTH
jgi:hypothetical protein